MDLAVLGSFLATCGSLAGLFFAIYTVRKMNSKLEVFEEIAASVGGLFRYEEDSEGKPMIDARLGKIISTFSSGIAQSLKMSLLGSLSGPARLDKGLKGAMAQDIVEQKMPMVNLIGDFLGFNTKKYIGKHPEAMMQLGSMIAPMLGNIKLGGGSNPRSGNDGVGYGT
ncbi:MAG: hypothetical protein ABIH76_03645 [Candidatus Bathyarchaeota archaeon]